MSIHCTNRVREHADQTGDHSTPTGDTIRAPDPSLSIKDPSGTVTDPSAQDLWDRALNYLPLYMDRRTFNHWFHGTRALAIDGDCLVVQAHTARAVEWLENRLAPVVDRAISPYLPGIHVRFVAPFTNPGTQPATQTPQPEIIVSGKNSPTPHPPPALLQGPQPPQRLSASPPHPEIIVSAKKPPPSPNLSRACPERSERSIRSDPQSPNLSRACPERSERSIRSDPQSPTLPLGTAPDASPVFGKRPTL